MTKKHHSENLSEQTNDFYKEYYNKPRWWFKYRYDTQYKMKSAINALKNIGFDHKGKKIFEFGFGSGELITTFIGADFISGTEISKFSVFLSNNRADKLKFRRHDFQVITDTNNYLTYEGTFDLVIASHVIEHIEDTQNFIAQVFQLLDKEGITVIQAPINERYDDPKHFHKFSTLNLKQLFTENGFSIIYSNEDDFLFNIVEKIYQRNSLQNWNFLDNIIRMVFNLFFSSLSFSTLRFAEKIYLKFSKYGPRQTVIVYKKNKE